MTSIPKTELESKAGNSAADSLDEGLRLAVQDAPNAFGYLVALAAGGALLAASAAVFSMAGGFPSPGQQAAAGVATLLVGLVVIGVALSNSMRKRSLSLSIFGVCTLLVMAMPLARYVPLVYTEAYKQNFESLFPPLWPYSLSIPLLVMLMGDLVLFHRRRTGPAWLLVMSIIPAGMLLFFGSEVVNSMTYDSLDFSIIPLPRKVFMALSICIGGAAMIILGTVAAIRGLMWVGVVVLLATGLFLEIGSILFYGGIPRYWTEQLIADPYSAWVPFLAGTLPGALILLMIPILLMFAPSQREPR